MNTLVSRGAVARVLAGAGAVAVLALPGCYDDGHPQPGACTFDGAVAVANEGWLHVNDEAKLVYQNNPPASGPHFPEWASYGIHDDVVNRGNWVHNLEHGAIVLLIGKDASDDEKQGLLDGYTAISDDANCHHRRTVVTADPQLDSLVAAVAANIVLAGDSLSTDQIKGFAEACRDRGPEDICL